jgi:tetratricopeptide (TPR) repeat protein
MWPRRRPATRPSPSTWPSSWPARTGWPTPSRWWPRPPLGKASDADYARAADLIAAARAAAPGSADLAVSTADLLDARGQYDAAIAAYREILAKDPGKPLALNNLAWLLALHANQPDEAVALADRAIAVVGPVDIYLDTRGVAHLRAGRPQQAVSDLTAGLEQAQRPDTLFHLALANEKRGSTAEAQR